MKILGDELTSSYLLRQKKLVDGQELEGKAVGRAVLLGHSSRTE